MKINKERLHPLYDQYSNKENRLTHALLHTIGSSDWLFSKFLKGLVDKKLELSRRMKFKITTQKEPSSCGDSNSKEIGSVPDAWITEETSGLGITIEVKDIKNSLRSSQLESHARRIKEYKEQYLLIITPDLTRPKKAPSFITCDDISVKVVWHSWVEIYRWFRKISSQLQHSRPKEQFLVLSLIDYLERRAEVLGFQGIFFRKGFDVSEAKSILNAEMEELESFMKKIYKGLVRGRPAITTVSIEGVWDCFGLKDGFTKDIHFTFGINAISLRDVCHEISLTVPNSASGSWARLKTLFSDNNEQRLFSLLKDLRRKVPHLFIEFHQRHFMTPRNGIRDGFMEFNIDVLGKPLIQKPTKAKEFPMWLGAIRAAILAKKGINGQVMFKSRFYLNDRIDKPEFIETVKETVRAYKQIYNFLKS